MKKIVQKVEDSITRGFSILKDYHQSHPNATPLFIAIWFSFSAIRFVYALKFYEDTFFYIFLLSSAFLGSMLYWLEKTKSEIWKNFSKIVITLLFPFFLIAFILWIYEHNNRDKIFIEVHLSEAIGGEAEEQLMADKVINFINQSFESSKNFIETKFSDDFFATASTDIESNSNIHLLSWLGLDDIGKQSVKCIVAKSDTAFKVDLIFNVEDLTDSKIKSFESGDKRFVLETVKNEIGTEIIKKLYPLHALYMFASNKQYKEAVEIGRLISLHPESVLENSIYEKDFLKNKFIAYILTAYSLSESAEIENIGSNYKYIEAEELFNNAEQLKINQEDLHYFRAFDSFNQEKHEAAIKQLEQASRIDNSSNKTHGKNSKKVNSQELNIFNERIKKIIFENNSIYYECNKPDEKNIDSECLMIRINTQINEIKTLTNELSKADVRTIKRIQGRYSTLLSTKFEISFKYLYTENTIKHLFKELIDRGFPLDSISINDDPIYKDIIKLDSPFYAKHIKKLLPPDTQRYIQESIFMDKAVSKKKNR